MNEHNHDQEDFDKFYKNYLNNLHKAYKLSTYNELISYNRYLIDSIKMVVSGHIISILHNPYYLEVLSKLHKVTVSLLDGRIDIDNFIILLSDDDNGNISETLISFNIDIYQKDKLLLSSMVINTYNDCNELSFIDFRSDLLDNELKVTSNCNIEEILDNDFKFRKVAIYKNDLLAVLSDKLYEVLDPQEADSIITRPVFFFNLNREGDNNE